MNLHLFFEGTQAREQVASAFLATLLEQRTDVRNELFDILADFVGQELAESFKVRSWGVRVEKDSVDIRLDTKDEGAAWVILIENKLQSGSMQVGQLLRYYAGQIEREKQAHHIVAVYLAPRNIGECEVQLVKSSSFRPGDFAAHVSWDTVIERLQSLKPAEAGSAEFIRSGIESVHSVIKEAEEEKFPNVGERERIYQIVRNTREVLQQRFPGVRIGSPWRGSNRFTLGFSGTDITVWFEIAFEIEPNPPYRPLHLLEGDQMYLDVHSKLKLSGTARRKKESKSRWAELLWGGAVEIPGVGTHELQRSGWVVKETKVVAPVDSMASTLTDMGALLIQWTSAFQDEPVKM